MIKRRIINESLLRQATPDEVTDPPMSNGEGPLVYVDKHNATLFIVVCGSRRNPNKNEVQVILDDESFEEPYEWIRYGFSPEQAKMIGENLAYLYKNQGCDAMIKKIEYLGFWQDSPKYWIK